MIGVYLIVIATRVIASGPPVGPANSSQTAWEG